jgi:hypothetical protein
LPAADEAKDKLISRLQQVVLHTQKNKAYHQAINTLIGIVKKYAHKAQDALDETIEKSDISDEDEKVQQAGRDLKKFVENLAGKSMDGVIETSQKVRLATTIRRSFMLTLLSRSGCRRHQERPSVVRVLQRHCRIPRPYLAR